jgi:hypothetical protein
VLAPTSKDFYKKLHQPWDGFAAYFSEGVEGVVMSFEHDASLVTYINGSAHGGRPGAHFVEETMTALSSTETPTRALVIGVGTGAMMNALQLDNRVKSIDVVEVNKTLIDDLLMIRDISQGFDDKRVNLTIDDGRRFLERTTEKFDLITIDALRTRSAFSSNIYSNQFFELAKSKLSDNEKFLIWSDDTMGDIAKTLALSFEYIDLNGLSGLSIYFMITSNVPILRDPEIYEILYSKLDNVVAKDVHKHLEPALCHREGIARATVEASVNTDLRLNLEYYIGTIGTSRFSKCSE